MSRSAELATPRLTRARLAVVGAWLPAALALAYVARLTLAGLPRPAAPGGDGVRMQDLRDATYYPIRELWRPGGMPYDPQRMFENWPVVQEFDLYLPAHLWLHTPIAALDYPAAAVGMLAVNAALLALLARWACTWAAAPWWAWPALTAALIAGQVGKAQLYLGQVNPLVAVGVAGALGWRDRPRLAALCLALAWIKPQFGLPLTLLLLLRSRTAVALGGTALAALASVPVLVLLVVRAGGPLAFADVLRRNVEYATGTAYGSVSSPDSVRIDVTAALSRALDWTPPAAAETIAAAVVLVGIGLLVHRARTDTAPTEASLTTVWADLVTVLAVLVAVVHQPGDALAAVPAATALAVGLVYRRWPQAPPWMPAAGWAVVICLAVPHLHLYAVDQVVLEVAGARVAGLLDAAAVLLAAVLAVAALTALTAPSRGHRLPQAAT